MTTIGSTTTDSTSRDKAQRHQKLISSVSQTLIDTPRFSDMVATIAKNLAASLHAEYAGIFFRRKVDSELRRYALAINQRGEAAIGDMHRMPDDFVYSRDSKTLLGRPQDDRSPINFGDNELAGHGVNQTIVNYLRGQLPSKCFNHLIIVWLYIGDKQLGAIRVINHLDPSNWEPSRKSFGAEDVSVVSHIGSLLALAFANHRKGEKLDALNKLTGDLTRVSRRADAIHVCLNSLTSDEIGFPVAVFHGRDSEGKPQIIKQYSGNLAEPPRELASTPSDRNAAPLETPDSLMQDISGRLGLDADYSLGIEDGKTESRLQVFASAPAEFDHQSKTLIGTHAELLKGLLQHLRITEQGGIVGSSESMKQVRERAHRIARGDSTVMLLGQSGTGKEKLVRQIHDDSDRAGRPFATVNCAGLDTTTLESELFGHEKGAFTGAIKSRKGLFVGADKGTLFLDEIDKMPLTTQAKFLRILDNPHRMEIRPVGSEKLVVVDVRIVSATNKDLSKLVDDGKFLHDLYWRLCSAHILTLPPLSARKEDIPELVQHFLMEMRKNSSKRISVNSIDSAAMKALMNYAWKGNIRELQGTFNAAVELASGPALLLTELPERVQVFVQIEPVDDPAPRQTGAGLTQMESEYMRLVVSMSADLQQAARTLDVSAKSLKPLAAALGTKKGIIGPPGPLCTLGQKRVMIVEEVFARTFTQERTAQELRTSLATVRRALRNRPARADS